MHLYFVGDSYVNGYGDAEHLGWSGRVCTLAAGRNIDVTYYNLGIRRATSADLRRFWKDEVQRRVAATGEKQVGVVFSFGTNDCRLESGRRRITRGETLANCSGILSDARARFPIVMVGPPETIDADMAPELAFTNTDFKGACEKLKVPYLDLLELGKSMVQKRADSRGLDGWHPNSAWYAEVATNIDSWPAMRAMLDKLR